MARDMKDLFKNKGKGPRIPDKKPGHKAPDPKKKAGPATKKVSKPNPFAAKTPAGPPPMPPSMIPGPPPGPGMGGPMDPMAGPMM